MTAAVLIAAVTLVADMLILIVRRARRATSSVAPLSGASLDRLELIRAAVAQPDGDRRMTPEELFALSRDLFAIAKEMGSDLSLDQYLAEIAESFSTTGGRDVAHAALALGTERTQGERLP